MTLHAVIASRLSDGVVVFQGEGGWVTQLSHAVVTDDEQAAKSLLDRALADAVMAVVVEPYLIEIQKSDDSARPYWPVLKREAIRAFGPSSHPEFIKSG
jgi:hypothetical protein